MSLSLVPEYGSSSSESESENEVAKSPCQRERQSRSESSSRTGLGSALSSILPPPKSSAQGRTVKIVVDLPASKPAANTEVKAEMSKQSPSTSGLSNSSKGSGGMFSDLSRILPAPKNTTRTGPSRPILTAEEKAISNSEPSASATQQAVSEPQTALVPHSISKRQRAKAAAPVGQIKSKISEPVSANIRDNANAADEACDIDDQSESTKPKKAHIDQPFFTINASGQTMSSDNPVTSAALAIDDQSPSSDSNNGPSTNSAGPELHYDPTSGYYYDYVTGTYYYYDPDSQSYIDARNLLDASLDHGPDADPSGSDLLRLIGHKGVRRGELETVLSAPVRHVSQTAQLENSGYSDAKAAAEFAARQWSENKRKQTQTLIDADNVDKKKRQKHNIMYLALQAQEQEATLKEAFANRKRSKKEARSKYGY